MARNKIGITAQLDDQVTGRLGKIRDQFDRLGKSKGAMSILQGVGVGAGISAFNMLSSAVSGVVDIVGSAIKGAIEEEASIRKLSTALRANVVDWDGRTDAIERVITSQIDLGFSDEEQRDSLAMLTAATHDVTKALDIQRTAMDLARFKGISLAEASDALIKVEAGSYRILKSLGIELKKGATQTEALAAVQAIAAGQAEDYADTVEGKLLVAQTKLGEKMDDLGRIALPLVVEGVDALIEALDALQTTYAAPGDWWDDMTAGVQDFIDTLPKSELTLKRERKEALALRDALHSVGNKAAGAGDAAGDATGRVEDLGDAAGASAKKVDDLSTALDKLVEAALGPEEVRLRLSGVKDELRANEKEADRLREKIEKYEELGKPTGHLRDKLRDVKLETIENKTEAGRLYGRMLDLGRLNFSGAVTALGKLGVRLDLGADDAHRLLRDLHQISRITFGRYTGKTLPGMQHGGPVVPGGVYTVGESGSETLVMGDRGGYVIPHGGGGGAVGSPVVVQLNLDGRTVAEVVDRHLYYTAAAAPQSIA